MKAGIAVAMLAALNLADPIESGDLGGSLVVHAAIGEETAAPGTRTLLESRFDGDFGVVLEPTECRVATAAKGLAWYELRWPGEPSHASRPDQGHTGIDDLPAVRAAVDAYDERLRERTDPLCGQAYATVTRVLAGEGTNRAVLPDRAGLVLDRRILPGESLADVDSEVAALVEEVEREHGVTLPWERTETYASASIPTDHPLAETFREHAASVAGALDDPWGIEASTDVRDFVNDAGIPAITWGPERLEQAHTVDEYVDLSAAEAGTEALRRPPPISSRIPREVLGATQRASGSPVRSGGARPSVRPPPPCRGSTDRGPSCEAGSVDIPDEPTDRPDRSIDRGTRVPPENG